MTGPQVIVLATPVFLALIALEFAVGRARGRDTYRLNDALNSIGLGIMSQITGLFVALFTLGIYTAVHEHLAIWSMPKDSAAVWLGALIAYDFFYYWHHRAGHRIALFWASHAVHHQSEDYNLSTALRQTSGGWVAG
ncbi:MAG: sterol desaturase family protein, partial [Piscinibacter sp.]|nr:sterol desaturase family protein [Piscinibacter sp.]